MATCPAGLSKNLLNRFCESCLGNCLTCEQQNAS